MSRVPAPQKRGGVGLVFCLMFNVSGLRLKLTTFQLFLFSIRFHSPHRAVALSYPRPSTTDHAETRQAMSLLTPHSSDSLLKTHYLSHSHAFHPFPLVLSPPRSVVLSLFRSFVPSCHRPSIADHGETRQGMSLLTPHLPVFSPSLTSCQTLNFVKQPNDHQ